MNNIKWQTNLIWICVSLFLAMAGFSFAYPVLPFYIEEQFHLDESSRDMYISLFGFAGNLGFLICSPLWGKLGDLYGRRAMIIRANICSAVLVPLLAFMPDAATLTMLRFFIGAFSGVASASLTLVACSTPTEHRGKAMGLISSTIFSGNLVGMVIGGFCAATWGYTATFLLCAFIFAASAIIPWLLVNEDFVRRPFKFSLTNAIPRFGMVWYIMLSTMFMGLVQLLDPPYVPVLVKIILHGSSEEALRWNGLLGGVTAAAGMLGGFIIGALADRFSGYGIAVICCAAGALFLLPQSWCSSLSWLFAERVGMVFFISGLSPIMQSWLSLTTNPAERGTYFGYATSFRAIGWLTGSAIGGAITTQINTRSIFVAGAVALLVMIAVLQITNRKIPYPKSGVNNA